MTTIDIDDFAHIAKNCIYFVPVSIFSIIYVNYYLLIKFQLLFIIYIIIYKQTCNIND